MYIPAAFQQTDRAKLFEFIENHLTVVRRARSGSRREVLSSDRKVQISS